MLSAVVFLGLLAGQAEQPATLSRVFVKGERQQYSVKGGLQMEIRQPPLDTFLPFDMGVEYKFTTSVNALKADGIAEIRYQRPTMTDVQGETFESEEKRTVIKTNMDYLLDVSPINEILKTVEVKKEEPKKPAKPAKISLPGPYSAQTPAVLRKFTDEIFRLAMFVGSLDTALDFNPKLPYDEVKVGETWKRTVGYSPQRLSGEKGKSAVQRLDYVYTYKGMVDTDEGKAHRVAAALSVDTDAAEFINQSLGMKPEESGLKSLKLKLDAAIDFDLAPKTFVTRKAVARSEGLIHLEATVLRDRPLVEIKLKGETTMRLVASAVGK